MSSSQDAREVPLRPTQLISAVPGVRHDFLLSVADFGGGQAQLSTSTLLKYANDARLQAFVSWPVLARLMQDEPGADISVKAHLVRFLKPNTCLPATVLGVVQVG